MKSREPMRFPCRSEVGREIVLVEGKVVRRRIPPLDAIQDIRVSNSRRITISNAKEMESSTRKRSGEEDIKAPEQTLVSTIRWCRLVFQEFRIDCCE